MRTGLPQHFESRNGPAPISLNVFGPHLPGGAAAGAPFGGVGAEGMTTSNKARFAAFWVDELWADPAQTRAES